jgi:autotransporter-associated beta strand protein
MHHTRIHPEGSRARNPLTSLAASCLILLAGGIAAQAATATWLGTTDATWSNINNWDILAAPGTGDAAVFNGAGNGNTTINFGAGVTVSNVLFDTAGAAAYTMGSGAVGSQTLTLDNAAQLSLAAGVVNNQLFNANLSLSTVSNASATIANNSSALLTVAGGIVGNVASGNGLLTVSGSGNTTLAGPITKPGAGSMALLKTGTGTLTLSTNSVWSGSGAIGRVPATIAGFPLVAREGTLLLNGGTNTVNGELVIGGVVADGGAGQNAKIIVDGSRLDLTSWFSIGRGNGIGGVSSDLVLTNAAVVTAPNVSAGFNGGNTTNRPKGSITMGSSSTFTITGNGALNFGESLGSDFTWNLNDSAQFIALGTGLKHLGQNGKGTVNLNGNSSMFLGNANTYIGRTEGTGSSTGIVNMASSGIFSVAGELRVGGSQNNGLGRIAYGTLNVASGTVNLGALSVGRGNNNQNQCFGDVLLTGGTVTITNDVVIGFAGLSNYGKVTISGATLNVGPAATKWLMVGRWDTTSGQLDINSGVLNLMNNTAIKMNADGTIAPNVVNQNGGTVTFYSDNGTTIGGTGDLDLQRAGAVASVNTYNLNGGTLTVPRIVSSATTGTRTFNFNGGTLRAAGSSATFINLPANGVSRINVRNGGAIIDSNGKDITIVQSLDHSDIGGDNANDGGLRKSGDGTLTLAGGSTYTGPTIVSGGGLSLLPSAFSYSATDLTVSNTALSIDVSGNVSLSPLNLTLQNSTVLNLNFGSVIANPTAPAINVAGSLSAPGTGIVINISGFGLKPGSLKLIDYNGTALPNLANFTLGTLPPGVVATLVNDTLNAAIFLNITSAGQNLAWVGTNALTGLIDNTWDIAVTTNWVENGGSTMLRYQEYTTTSTVGDPVLFDDSVFNDFLNPQPTNINLTTSLRPFSVTVNSTLPYVFSGAGSLTGLGGIVKSNTGSLTLVTSNSYTGGTFIYGGSVVITDDSALGLSASKLTLAGGGLQVNASTTNATRAVGVVAASTIAVANNSTLQLGGVISGAGALSKIDNGTLILAGSNGITGNLSVDQGTLRNTGTEVLSAVARVGNTAGLNGVLNIPSGTFQAANNGGQFASSLIAGAVATSAGDIVLSGGTLNVMQQLGLGAGLGGYGGLTMSGGTLNCGSYIVVGFNNDRAVYNQSSGTTTISSNLMTIGAGGSGSIGVANISGGTFNSAFALSSGIMVGERGVGTLNVSGTAAINVPTNAGITIGPVASQVGWDGTLNLRGGTITANRVARGAGTGVARVNFNGGTLKASTANTAFLTGMDSATVYSGGAIFDDGGFAITVNQALQQPTDFGVSSISLSSGGSGYIDTPIVTISGGSGSNATATATVVGGAVTAITVTSPGTGYSSGDVLGVTFDSGGAAVTAASANVPVLAANLSGGLTKRGTGTLNLTGTNTFTSTISVTAGTLLMTPAHQVAGQPVTVASNAAFGVLANSTGTATVGNLTLGSTPLDRTTLSFVLTTGSNPVNPPLQVGTLTLNGTNTIRLSGTVVAGTFPLVKYTGAIAGSGVFTPNAIAQQGLVVSVSNHVAGSIIYLTVSGTPGIVWTGTNSVASLTNVWNLNSATNWLAAGVPTFYQETTPPGDAVTFNDIGSGVVILSNTASPANVSISNSTVNYAFTGTGRISGVAGLTKNGTGSVTFALAGNDYSGSTVISNGTFRLGSATTIPDGASASGVVVGSSGKIDLNGFSETINGLSGSGQIENTSGTASVLTLGSANSAVNWSGSFNNVGAGASIIKIGTGSATITGTNYLTSGAASQVNGGSLLLTNGGSFIMPTGEFWVAQNAGTGVVTVAGGTVAVSNNWLVIGRNNVAANGTLIVNSGLVQKGGANGNIVVGSLGAQGTLIVNGGQVFNSGMLWLGENATANATLQLNGGLVQATQVRPQNAVASATAYFNGGTLQASGNNPTNFIATTVTCNVQSGGAVIDDGGFTIAIPAALVEDGSSPGGGLIKKGSGIVYLDGANSYSGTTIVSNGVLGGIGSVASPVLVKSGAALAPGDGGIGTLTMGSTPTFQGSVVMEVDRNGGTPISDLIEAGSAPLVYGGTLVLTNAGVEPLQAGDTFKLFNTSGGYSGAFTLVTQTPGQSVTWNTSSLTVDGTIVVATVGAGIASNPTNITYSVSGGTLTLTWPTDHLGWILQSQTNSLGLGLRTNWFDLAGSETVTTTNLTVSPTNPAVFFRLRHP